MPLWGPLGAISEGLAEGYYMGSDLSMRKQQMQQQAQQQQLQNALGLLGMGAKVEDPQFMQVINTMLGKVVPGMQLPVVDTTTIAQREAGKAQAFADALAQRMGIQKGSPQYTNLLNRAAGFKDMPEMVEYTDPATGRTTMITSQQWAAITAANQRAQDQNELRLLIATMKGEGKGGGGKSEKEDYVTLPFPDSKTGLPFTIVPTTDIGIGPHKKAPIGLADALKQMTPTEEQYTIEQQGELGKLAEKKLQGNVTPAEEQILKNAGVTFSRQQKLVEPSFLGRWLGGKPELKEQEVYNIPEKRVKRSRSPVAPGQPQKKAQWKYNMQTGKLEPIS